MTRTLLIDGDIVIYQYASTVEHEVDWGDDVWSMWADAKEAKELILQYIEHLKEATIADDVVFCLSDKDNFRKEIYPEYKANRKGKRKPTIYKALVDWVHKTFETQVWEGLEADDVLGILQTSDTIKGETVIVSEDKDLLTVPGLLWRQGELHNISQEEADFNFFTQILTGDSVDNYGGCTGIGAVRAERILKEKGATWATIVDTYKKANLTEDYALIQARLARILRAEDFVWEFLQPKLWSPNA